LLPATAQSEIWIKTARVFFVGGAKGKLRPGPGMKPLSRDTAFGCSGVGNPCAAGSEDRDSANFGQVGLNGLRDARSAS